MKIFKFGGASVKDADAVVNVTNILNQFAGQKNSSSNICYGKKHQCARKYF